MLIELYLPDVENVIMPISHYNPEVDDIRSILADICQFIDNICHFKISGFGQNSWPVTMNTDLPVLLEQLPKVLKAVSLGNSTEIAFYEQGIERIIVLHSIEDFYELSCLSQTNWQPDPKVEHINTINLIEMIANFLEKFTHLVCSIAPQLAKHQWFKDWLNP